MVTITRATPHVVTWRVGNSLHIESTREAVESWRADAEWCERLYVDGLLVTKGDLNNMLAAMDDAAAQEAYDVRLEKVLDRAADFASNWEA